ncbi:PaaI family thioesterase [Halostella pelagica]|uniref:PaaI family thioesterase n=1 Tax=Halostella pelagica TaxID=2583824 RepID=UPI001081CBAA|nr:hotdog fold thioesterase [Halostella pelagica]
MSDDPESMRARAESDPYCETLGIELVEMDSGHARTELTVGENHLNFHGTVHGGAIYSLADAAFAAASNSHGETAFALETNISYLDMTETGTTLDATATETYNGRRTAEYRVEVSGPGDDPIATFRGRVYKPGSSDGE